MGLAHVTRVVLNDIKYGHAVYKVQCIHLVDIHARLQYVGAICSQLLGGHQGYNDDSNASHK